MRAGVHVGAHDVLPRPRSPRRRPCRGRAPWRAPRRRGRRRPRTQISSPTACRVSSAGEPSAASRPPVMIATRSQSVSASSIACVVSSTVTPRSRRSRTRSHVVARACGSMPAVGSSRNTTSGPADERAREREPLAPGRPRAGAPGVPTASAEPDEVEQRLGRLGALVVRANRRSSSSGSQARVEPARLQHHADLRAQARARRARDRARARARSRRRAGGSPRGSRPSWSCPRRWGRAARTPRPRRPRSRARRPRASIRTTCVSPATEIAGSAEPSPRQESRHAT